jgi:hypothetical protein
MGPPVQVCVYYDSTFEQGDGDEQFSFAKNGGKLQLLEYGIIQWSQHFARAFLAGETSVLHQ